MAGFRGCVYDAPVDAVEDIDVTLTRFVADNPGQGTVEEYRYLYDLIVERAPCRLLIFGVGKDSKMWVAANAGGTTEFVEHELEWIGMTRKQIPGVIVHEVTYKTKRKHWKKMLDRTDDLLMQDLPASVTDTAWDIIYVDSPQGGNDRRPGRMKSIYTASRIAARGKQTDVVLHDCDREVERVYGDKYLGEDNLVAHVGRTRHYR